MKRISSFQLLSLFTGMLLTALCVSCYVFIQSPGQQRQLKHWSSNQLPLTPFRPTLIMFLHPKCQCSIASLQILYQLLPEIQQRLEIVLVLESYAGLTRAPSSEFELSLRRITGARIVEDVSGALARDIGAETSGVTYLVDESRKVIFQGGLSESRGQASGPQSQGFIREWIVRRTPAHLYSEVFGCAL